MNSKLVLAALARVIAQSASVFASAVLWFLLTGVAGVAVLVVGVFVLAGSGWACIAGGAALVLISALIARGMSHG